MRHWPNQVPALVLFCDSFGRMPNDNNGSFNIKFDKRMDDMQYHRTPTDEVQWLWSCRLHAGSLASSEDDGSNWHGKVLARTSPMSVNP